MAVIDWWNGPLSLVVISLRCACCCLLEVSPVSLVVLAIRLALFFIVTHTHTILFPFSSHVSLFLASLYFSLSLCFACLPIRIHTSPSLPSLSLPVWSHLPLLSLSVSLCLSLSLSLSLSHLSSLPTPFAAEFLMLSTSVFNSTNLTW